MQKYKKVGKVPNHPYGEMEDMLCYTSKKTFPYGIVPRPPSAMNLKTIFLLPERIVSRTLALEDEACFSYAPLFALWRK